MKDAAGYIVYDGERVLGITTATTFWVLKVNSTLKVAAVNQYGAQGKKNVVIENKNLE